MFTKIKLLALSITIALALAAMQCSPPPAQPAAGEDAERGKAVDLSAVDLAGSEKLNVVATTNIVGDLVGNVGGDRIALTTMLPIGVDPHTFTPAPQDVATVAGAHVVFINGLNLEEFLDDLIENAGGEATVVALSTNVETREFKEATGHEEDETEEGHHHEGADTHIWMSPANAIIMVHNIERALSELDPANAETYEANTEAYVAQLEDLDAWVKDQIESIPTENRELVTDHDAFGYYADRYGLEVIGTVIPAASTGAEPAAADLAALQEAIADYDAKAIFAGATTNPRLAEQLARDSGIQLVFLYTGSLGGPGSGAESYLDLIRANSTAIVGALSNDER